MLAMAREGDRNLDRREQLSAEEWWKQNEDRWGRDPGYYANLEHKARKHGKEWVRKHKPMIDRYWRYAEASRLWRDAPLPEGYEKHAAWLLERGEQRFRATRGYLLYELDFLAREGELLTDSEFERAIAEGIAIPFDPLEH